MIYTLADKDVMLHLLQYLNPLKEDLNVSIWHDDPINPGQPLKTYLESRIHHTDLFLLLVSDNFMNSQFITQNEFKAIIDRHKDNESKVIPILIDNCQWDVDLALGDYVFNLKELQVLPEGGNFIGERDSSDDVYKHVAEGIKTATISFLGTVKLQESEKKTTKNTDEEQVAIPFDEEVEADKPTEEGKPSREAVEAEEQNAQWEEAEVKRRAEVAKRIKEQAEASAKRRAEEDRLWEEAMAQRKAKKEQKIRDEVAAAANRSVEEEDRMKKEAEAERIAEKKSAAEAAALFETEKENRLKEKAEAKRSAEKEKMVKDEAEASRRETEQENKFKETADPKRSAEKEIRLKEEAEAKERAEGEKMLKGAGAISSQHVREKNSTKDKHTKKGTAEATNRPKPPVEANNNTKEIPEKKNLNIKKRVLVGSLIAALVVLGIWAFSFFNTGSKPPLPPEQKNSSTAVKDSIVSSNNIVDSLNNAATFSELAVGDTYDGGIIFTMDPSGTTGKIAQLKDAGPMPWKDAMNIEAQLAEGWRLPTFEELEEMYQTIGQGADNSGEFADALYWSATDFDEYQARLLKFSNGNASYHYNKDFEHRKFLVRAIRNFSR